MNLLRTGLLSLMLLAFLAGCTQPFPNSRQSAGQAGSPPRPAREQTLIMAVRVEPVTIAARPLGNPSVAIKASGRVFNAALDLIDDRNVPRPYLAESLPQLNTDTWRLLPDGRMETIYRLKPNLVWHDGIPLTAHDFVFSWRTYATLELGAASSAPISLMEEATAPDDRTLRIRWRQPYPQAGVLQASGRLSEFPALPRHILEAAYDEGQWDAFAAHPFWTREFVGLGPYKLERWDPGTSIEGVAFADHVGGRPRIDRVRLIFTPDSNSALANLLSGGIHIAMDNAVFFQQGITAKREWAPVHGGTLLVTTDLYRATYVQFRPEVVNPRALTDARVRKALAHALDKLALNDTLYEGEGIMTDTILPPVVDYYAVIDKAVTRYPYDLRRTEQLMREAGFARGSDGMYEQAPEGRLAFELKVNASALYENERTIMASGWRQGGFDVQEAVLPAAQAQDGQARATFSGMYSFSTGLGEGALANFVATAIPRPDTRWFGNNRGAWSSPEYDRLSGALNATLQQDQRVQLISDMTRILSDELPAIPLYYDLGAVPHVAVLHGPVPVGPDTSGLVAWNIVDWELN